MSPLTSLSMLRVDLSARTRRYALVLIALGYAGASLHLYIADGQAYPSVMLLPVLIASLGFGIPGAILSAGMAALLMASFFGHDVADFKAELLVRASIYLFLGLSVAIPMHVQGYYRRKLNYLLMHDAGTNLPGRRALFDALVKALSSDNSQDRKNGLLVIVIENMQDIALTFGYDAADSLIKTLWDRLAVEFSPGAEVYHYHRERLAVLFEDPPLPMDGQLRRIEQQFQQSIVFDGIPIHFVALLGFAPLAGTDHRLLINQAESAVDFARAKKLQSAVYSASMTRNRKEAMMLLGDVVSAMQSGSLHLHYQPKINLKTSAVVGYEGLARWHHPTLGNVAPDRFIPLIVQTELIQAFTRWVVTQALTSVKTWEKCGHRCTVAVNISSHNLANDNFASEVRELLLTHRVHSGFLELEVTETEIMKDPEQAITVLQQLKDIPIVISIDDFGTGYSSLAYLHKLPATTIKIDGFFTQHMDEDPMVFEIVAATIGLAHKLGMTVVAEGIETEVQLNGMTALGCDFGQGYYFARAMALADAVDWTKTFQREHGA